MDRQMLEREIERERGQSVRSTSKLLMEEAAATKQKAEREVQRARELQDRLAKLQLKLQAAAKARKLKTTSRPLRSTFPPSSI